MALLPPKYMFPSLSNKGRIRILPSYKLHSSRKSKNHAIVEILHAAKSILDGNGNIDNSGTEQSLIEAATVLFNLAKSFAEESDIDEFQNERIGRKEPKNEENQEKLPSSIITGELKEDQENQEIPLKEIEIGSKKESDGFGSAELSFLLMILLKEIFQQNKKFQEELLKLEVLVNELEEMFQKNKKYNFQPSNSQEGFGAKNDKILQVEKFEVLEKISTRLLQNRKEKLGKKKSKIKKRILFIGSESVISRSVAKELKKKKWDVKKFNGDLTDEVEVSKALKNINVAFIELESCINFFDIFAPLREFNELRVFLKIAKRFPLEKVLLISPLDEQNSTIVVLLHPISSFNFWKRLCEEEIELSGLDFTIVRGNISSFTPVTSQVCTKAITSSTENESA